MSQLEQLIKTLELTQHPEGGWYKEIFRSAQTFAQKDGNERSFMTSIYFLLGEGHLSRWHVVEDADESWHFYEGAPLELLVAPPDLSQVHRVILGDVSQNLQPVHVVPAGWWQAARSTGAYSLVGCNVSPAFQFSSFRFLNDEEQLVLEQHHPGFVEFI